MFDKKIPIKLKIIFYNRKQIQTSFLRGKIESVSVIPNGYCGC